MGDGKKDILDMDFGQLSIPQAIGITAQAITKCVEIDNDDPDIYDIKLKIDNDRVAELMEKLEARVQDDLDAKLEPTKEAELDALDEENVDWSDVVLLEDGMIANVKGVVYQKACNEPVRTYLGDDGEDHFTYCIKRFGHVSIIHEDEEGEGKL